MMNDKRFNFSEDIVDYIDQLKLEHDRLLLKCAQLLLESQEKDRIIKQLMGICDSWHNEVEACVKGEADNDSRRNRGF